MNGVDTLSHNKNDEFVLARKRLIEKLMSDEAFYSSKVLQAMGVAPRQLFISEALHYRAYHDTSLPIGFNQTISKPSTIAKMITSLDLHGNEHVLEIGTGTGYQSSILAKLAAHVTTTERIAELYERACKTLIDMLEYRNLNIIHNEDFNSLEGDFDAIIVAAGADVLPEDLIKKLRTGGRMVIPVGAAGRQRIKRYTFMSTADIIEDTIGPAEFVPLIHH